MAFTQAQIDALEIAIASGTKRVKYDGKEIEYQSVEQMQKALAMMKSSLNKAAQGLNSQRPSFGKGTC